MLNPGQRRRRLSNALPHVDVATGGDAGTPDDVAYSLLMPRRAREYRTCGCLKSDNCNNEQTSAVPPRPNVWVRCARLHNESHKALYAGTSWGKTQAVLREDGCIQDEDHFFSDAFCFTENQARLATDAEVESLPGLKDELCIIPIAYRSKTDGSQQFCCRYYTADQDENLNLVKSRIINDLRAAYDSLTEAEKEAGSQGGDLPKVVQNS